jgi:vacuolar-type H+-ATPase subunit E/Vma4
MSLIDQIISLEKNASTIVDDAHAQAKSIARQAETQVETIRAEIDRATEKRVEQYRAEAETKLQDALAGAEAEFNAAHAALGRIDDAVLRTQLEQIVARVKGV